MKAALRGNAAESKNDEDPSDASASQEADRGWMAQQRGRELTVYIFHHTPIYARGPMTGLAPVGTDHEFDLGMEYQAAYTSAFWFRFIRTVERRLTAAGIRSNGLASGDLVRCAFSVSALGVNCLQN